MFDMRFRVPSSWILAGPSQSGKTRHTSEILRNIDSLFADPRIKQNVVYFYNQWQSAYDVLNEANVVTHWISEEPTLDLIRSLVQQYKHSGGSVVVIDDRSQSMTAELIEVFTVLSHHLNFVVLLLTQNIFNRNPVFREMSLNATYVVLFKNPRDASQITFFARQFMPSRSRYIIDAFREATDAPYGYLLFDTAQETPNMLRVRSNVLPHELPMVVYVRKTSSI